MADAQPTGGWPCEWSGLGRGNRRSQEEARWGALQRLHAWRRQSARYAVVQLGGNWSGDQHARTANIKVHVQPWLRRIILWPVAYGIVVVMIRTLVMGMAVMVMMVVMALVAMLMNMDEGPGERTGWCGVGHGQGWRPGEYQRHHPNEGDAASARSFQLHQHACSLTLDYQSPQGVSKAYTRSGRPVQLPQQAL
jgi:hypothetical protein